MSVPDKETAAVEVDAFIDAYPVAVSLRRLVRSKYGTASLAAIAFIESFLPVPIVTDPFLALAVLLNRTQVYFLIAVTTIASTIGGVMAYYVVIFFRDVILSRLSPELLNALNTIDVAESSTFLITIVGAVTPVPYTLVAWAVGLYSGNVMAFIVASIIGRGFRYVVVGWCVHRFGPVALQYARRSILVASLGIFCVIGLYIWLKL